VVDVPDLGDGFHRMWEELIRLNEAAPAPWTLIGAHMVALHGWARGREQIRPSRDADILVNVRAVADGTARLSQVLLDREYTFDGASPEGVGHRFVKGEISIDVLGPDGVGERADLRTVDGAHTVRVPGGTQALRRSVATEVRSRSTIGAVPLPNLLGAILVKVRAILVDDQPEAQRRDAAFLLSLVADPDHLVADLSGSERGWLRRHEYLADPIQECYRGIADAEDAAIVYRRLAKI
jgi:predicted nucleotidyltransferase